MCKKYLKFNRPGYCFIFTTSLTVCIRNKLSFKCFDSNLVHVNFHVNCVLVEILIFHNLLCGKSFVCHIVTLIIIIN